MTDNLFNTPADEIDRLVTELRETKEALRDLSGKLTRIETRLKRVFPQAFPKAIKERKEKPLSENQPTSLTPETAMVLYEELVQHARNDRLEQVSNRLSSLSIPDLSFLRRELGASLGKRKPTAKTLIEAIVGRIRESVMLSKHTDRQQLLGQSGPATDSTKESDKG